MDSTKTLPASWYCSQNLYQLEQRAVFYKAWYFVGAVPRFSVEREVEYEFAGVAVTVRHDGDENFTVTRKSDVCFIPSIVSSFAPTPLIRFDQFRSVCSGGTTRALFDADWPLVCNHRPISATL